MHFIFMNSENSKSSDSHRLLVTLSDKTDLINMLLYQISVYIIYEKA